ANTLPQIFLKSGSKYFYSTKLMNNKETPFPFMHFLWESPDGSRVMMYLNRGGLGAFSQHRLNKKRRRLLKPGLEFEADYTIDKPEEKDVYSDEMPPVAAFMGQGDGGHGPTGREVAMLDYMVDNYNIEWITATKYFNEILEPYRDRLPVWKDELYYEFHRGTLSTQSLVKRMNRYFEWHLCCIESLVSLISLVTGENTDYVTERLGKIWKLTLLNQFHDVLPGSSIPEVYDDCYDFWDYGTSELKKIENEIWKRLFKHQQSEENSHENMNENMNERLIIFNGTGQDVKNVPVEIEYNGDEIPEYVKIRNNVRPVQLVAEDPMDLDAILLKRPNRLLFTADIPQHSFLLCELLHKNEETSDNLNPSAFIIEESDGSIGIENEMYSLKVNKKTGNIDFIYDKQLEKNVLSNKGIILKVFFDWLPDEPCWNLLPTYRELEINMDPPKSVLVTDDGSMKCTIEIKREFLNEDSESEMNATSTIIQRISLINGAPGIYIDFLIDWNSCETTFKLDVATATNAEYTISETPYGSIKRLTNPIANHDKPRWENFHHTWVDLPAKDESWGFAILNNGKYGYDANPQRIGLTVIRGPKYPAPSKEAWVHTERSRRKEKTNDKPPTHADVGQKHLINYVLLPHKGKWTDSDPDILAHAHWLNYGYASKWVPKGTMVTHLSGITTDALIKSKNPNVELSVIKDAQDGSGKIIRIVELKHQRAEDSIIFDKKLKIKKIIETDLLERDISKQKSDATKDEQGNIIKLKIELNPHEIRTFKIIQ
ncbi:MAG: hypothetical protein GF364_01585, partial [Candidatus Lokiarchaeota archaeon]|nr:hypothetical protein [Candidatus Lokiarchaeota archaeon]